VNGMERSVVEGFDAEKVPPPRAPSKSPAHRRRGPSPSHPVYATAHLSQPQALDLGRQRGLLGVREGLHVKDEDDLAGHSPPRGLALIRVLGDGLDVVDPLAQHGRRGRGLVVGAP